jgi:large subunit ribosomal protein L6
MSRIGLLPITIPQGVEVKIEGNEIRVRGEKGEISRRLTPDVAVSVEEGKLLVTRTSDDRVRRSLHGLVRSLIANMVEGVSRGFQRELQVNGVGYRVQKAEGKLLFQIGYSHTVEFPLPPGVDATVEGTNRIRIAGIDKEMVGEVAAKIRGIRATDRYKGKGVIYAEEKLHLKPGKVGRVSKG